MSGALPPQDGARTALGLLIRTLQLEHKKDLAQRIRAILRDERREMETDVRSCLVEALRYLPEAEE